MITTIADVDGNEHLHNVDHCSYFLSYIYSFKQTTFLFCSRKKKQIFSFTHKQVYVSFIIMLYLYAILNHNVIMF